MYRSKVDEKILNGRSILQCALDVHMTETGSYERDIYEQISDVFVLENVINEWKPSLPKYEEFDNAVKNLITIVIKEYYATEP